MYFVTQLLDPEMQLSRAAFLFEDVVQEELSTSYLFGRDIHTICECLVLVFQIFS